jgi:surface antigen
MWRTLSALLTFAALAAIGVIVVQPNLRPRTETAAATAPAVAEAPAAAPAPASTPSPQVVPVSTNPAPAGVTAIVDRSGAPLQCAIYARQRTGISLTGAARNWWPQAEGRYRRSHTPSVGSVIVLDGTSAGHVAVVTRVIGARQIVVDHANWLGGGEIITGALVEDASAANDWSQVRVWNVQTNSMGLRPYPVFGFVGPGTV